MMSRSICNVYILNTCITLQQIAIADQKGFFIEMSRKNWFYVAKNKSNSEN